MTITPQTLDCRGMQCPQPILTLATAARRLGGAGTLLVQADDDAFPMDVRSWCRSAGADLEALEEVDGEFRARIRVGAERSTATAPPLPQQLDVPSIELTKLDCRGMQCPEPILQVAKAARAGRRIEVTADDPAFELDLRSWCRSTGATLDAFETRGDGFVARLTPKGARTPTPPPPPPLANVRLEGMPTPLPSAAALAAEPLATVPSSRSAFELDLTTVSDPLDLERRLGALATMAAGLSARVSVLSVALAQTVLRWAPGAGHAVVRMTGSGPVVLELAIASEEEPLAPFSRATLARRTEGEADCALLVLHNDLEALLAAMLIANGAAAQGQRVVVFFTFWGLNLLRGDAPNLEAPKERVSILQRVFKWLMPKGPRRQQLGQLNFGGAGARMLGGLMRDRNIMELPSLVQQAEEQGVKFVACTMSMSVMGITKRDLAPRRNLAYGGVAYFVEAAKNAQVSLTF